MSATDWLHSVSATGLEWYYAINPSKRPSATNPKPPTPTPGGGGPAAIFNSTNPYFGALIVGGVIVIVGLLFWLLLR